MPFTGADRYATAEKVFDTFFAGRSFDEAFVATGTNFPDALTASAAGGALDVPVLLVRGTSSTSLPDSMVGKLKAAGVKTLNLVGGESAVSKPIRDKLKAEGFELNELGGENRYETNQAVNDFLKWEGVTGLWVASGRNFPDALSAAVPASQPDQRLTLSPGNCLPKPVADWVKDNTLNHVTLVGGKTVLGQGAFDLTACSK